MKKKEFKYCRSVLYMISGIVQESSKYEPINDGFLGKIHINLEEAIRYLEQYGTKNEWINCSNEDEDQEDS